MVAKSCNVLLVSPKFPLNTFWNNKATCRVQGARHSAIPLGLITVAALLPKEWTCRLVDRNTRNVTADDLAWADLVMTGGMNIQRPDCLDFISLAQSQGKIVVVGGPDVTSEPHFYAQADFCVLGEAETIIQEFIFAWQAGQRRGVFTAEKFKVDVTRSPIPRFDLIRASDYLYFAVQFSRGCPFTCEFCDIIELYGRVPRVKTPTQILGELDALYRSGYRGHLDFVDDNFIGNKKAVKAFLPHLISWQKERNYPFALSTEASINLADDDALLALMREAGFAILFVGIESPDGDTLVAMQKKQNARRDLAESVRKIYRAGMFVIAGFIVGFDSEKGSIADDLVQYAENAKIPICMVGLLTALANTQLAARLKKENRIYPVAWQAQIFGEGGGDQCTLGLNFETRRPRRDVLSDYFSIVARLYSPKAYFRRLDLVAEELDIPSLTGAGNPSPSFSIRQALVDLWALLRLLSFVVREQPMLLGYYLKAFYSCFGKNPAALPAVGIMAAFYLHLYPFSRTVLAAIGQQINEIDRGNWVSPLTTMPEDASVEELRGYMEAGTRKAHARAAL